MDVEPIGRVRSGRTEPRDDDWDAVPAAIELDADRFGPAALAGLEEFSHVEVVFAFDRVDPTTVQAAPGTRAATGPWPEVGIFAQRGKARPNRIGCHRLPAAGASTGCAWRSQGLDAIDGTPVLDIKPYMAEFAPRGQVRQPGWSHELMAGYWRG